MNNEIQLSDKAKKISQIYQPYEDKPPYASYNPIRFLPLCPIPELSDWREQNIERALRLHEISSVIYSFSPESVDAQLDPIEAEGIFDSDEKNENRFLLFGINTSELEALEKSLSEITEPFHQKLLKIKKMSNSCDKSEQKTCEFLYETNDSDIALETEEVANQLLSYFKTEICPVFVNQYQKNKNQPET